MQCENKKKKTLTLRLRSEVACVLSEVTAGSSMYYSVEAVPSIYNTIFITST